MSFSSAMDRTEFRLEDGMLVKAVTPRIGDAYEHRCSEDQFRRTAQAIEDLGVGIPFAVCDLVGDNDFAYSATYVAAGLLYECSLLNDAHGRRLVAVDGFDVAAAMAEFHGLPHREESP